MNGLLIRYCKVIHCTISNIYFEIMSLFERDVFDGQIRLGEKVLSCAHFAWAILITLRDCHKVVIDLIFAEHLKSATHGECVLDEGCWPLDLCVIAAKARVLWSSLFENPLLSCPCRKDINGPLLADHHSDFNFCCLQVHCKCLRTSAAVSLVLCAQRGPRNQ